MKPQTIIIYHSADGDGYFSGFLASMNFQCPVLYPCNYGQDPSLDGYNLDDYDRIVLVDFSLPDEDMIEYQSKITWIDHHAPVIQRLENSGYTFEGIQDTSGKYSAAYLCWKYWYGDRKMPEAIKLVSAYDVFNKSGEYADWQSAYEYQIYLRTQELSLDVPLRELQSNQDDISKACEIGSAILRYKENEKAKAYKNNAFDVTIGEYRGKCLLSTDMSSMMTEGHIDKDFILLVNRIGNAHIYKMSVRVSENSGFDAAEFCHRHRGGGHSKAAGGTLSEEDFISLLRTGRID